MADVAQGSYETLLVDSDFWEEKLMQIVTDTVGAAQTVQGGSCGPVGVSRPTFSGPSGPS